jgi:uncharacterized protein involved in exopolysaccharide biosynthesis
VTGVVLGVALLLPNEYTATATLLPPEEDSGLGGLLSGLSGSPALSRAFGFDAQDKTQLYLGVLQSERIARGLVAEHDLQRVYRKRDIEKAMRELDRRTGILTTPEGFVRIEVTDRDRARAAALANGYVAGLDAFLQTNTNSAGRARREYLDARLEEARRSLMHAEDALRDLQVARRLPAAGLDAGGASSALGDLVAEKVRREVELGTIQSVARGTTPRAQQLRNEIAQFEREIAKLPPAATDLTRLAREVRIQERILLVLTEERERARLVELRTISGVEVVDRAEPPIHKSWPRRMFIAAGAFALSLLAGTAWAWTRAGVMPGA